MWFTPTPSRPTPAASSPMNCAPPKAERPAAGRQGRGAARRQKNTRSNTKARPCGRAFVHRGVGKYIKVRSCLWFMPLVYSKSLSCQIPYLFFPFCFVKILGRPLNFFRFPVANFAFLNFGKPHNPVFLYFIFLCALNKNLAGTG